MIIFGEKIVMNNIGKNKNDDNKSKKTQFSYEPIKKEKEDKPSQKPKKKDR